MFNTEERTRVKSITLEITNTKHSNLEVQLILAYRGAHVILSDIRDIVKETQQRFDCDNIAKTQFLQGCMEKILKRINEFDPDNSLKDIVDYWRCPL